MKNGYSFRSRISEAKIREIARCFSVDLTALQAAELTGTKVADSELAAFLQVSCRHATDRTALTEENQYTTGSHQYRLDDKRVGEISRHVERAVTPSEWR